MPRSKNFSPALVRQQLADTFVANGFGGTSLAMLEEACGVGKQSLYNVFGDKRAMYLDAVDCAVARFAAVGSAMASAPDGAAALKLFFEHLLADCTSGDSSRRACIVSAGLLEGIDDHAVRAHLQNKWQATHELLLQTLRRGQADGSLNPQLGAQASADQLMTLMNGLRVTANTEVGADRLRQVVDQTLAPLLKF